MQTKAEILRSYNCANKRNPALLAGRTDAVVVGIAPGEGMALILIHLITLKSNAVG